MTEEWQEDHPFKKHPDTIRMPILKRKMNGDARKNQTNLEYRELRVSFGWDCPDEVL